MSIKISVAKNTFFQLIAKFGTSATTLLLTIIISRLLGTEIFADYTVVVTYVTLFFILADFGVNAIVVKDFSQRPSSVKDNYTKLISFRMFTGLLIMFVALTLLRFMPYEDNVKQAIIITVPILLFQSMYKAPSVIFQSFLKYKYFAISSVLGSLTVLLSVILLINLTNVDVIILSACLSFGYLITLIFGLFFTRKYISLSTKIFDLKYWKYIFLDALPLGIGLFFNTIMIQADRFLLSILVPPIYLAIYSIAYRIFEFVIVIPTYFMNSVYPILSSKILSDQAEYKRLVSKTIKYLFLGATLTTLLITPISKYIIGFIWPGELSLAYIPLNILVTGSVLFFISAPLSWIVLLEGKQRSLPYIYGIAMLINIMLNIIFIPKYNYVASSVITVITELMVLISLYLVLRSRLVEKKGNLAENDVIL